jgi:hypothetical protein
MANLTHSELAEITPTAFPPASVDNLKEMRNQLCGSKSDFQLQSQQRFLRRVLSPDAPSRNLLAVHGTGVGKTCTAIQIAEEYIIRPEFQDKRVLVITSPAVQDNFQSELFRMDRVYLNKDANNNVTGLLSQQCTGRRYLDMLLRIQPDLNNWENPVVRERLDRTADRILNEFYEFMGYNEFADLLNTKLNVPERDLPKTAPWVHETFDNRLIIIDEAHNIREVEEGGSVTRKGVTQALERLSQIAEGMVLVLLTATPMYDNYEEIIFYMNLFLWNDRKQDKKTKLKPLDIFNDDATLKSGAVFRDWCQKYVSYVRGESPFTFPFRLPPPQVAPVPSRSFENRDIEEANRLKYIPIVVSTSQGIQAESLARRAKAMEPTLAVLPGAFDDVFRIVDGKYDYADPSKPVLKPEFLASVSAKFATILRIIENSSGVVMVYSNSRKMGSDLFAMTLEEHGYRPATTKSMAKNSTLMLNPTEAVANKRYALLTPETPDRRELMQMIRSDKNRNGALVRVILTSPATSEGVDFRFIRQVHILDPWWNMSRMEQVAGRAMRTCSHQLLSFEEQNCTIYYHVVRTPDNQECYDEFTYRERVVPKAMQIARVRKVMAESAMDCPLQNQVNTLPEDWKKLEVAQKQSEGGTTVELPLSLLMAPTFSETPDVSACVVTPSVTDPDHVRPLSSYIDVRDEILGKLSKLLVDKPIWSREHLIGALKEYSADVVVYTLQNAISSGFRFQDAYRRPALLESRDNMYALAPIGIPNRTMVERTTEPAVRKPVDLPEPVEEVKPVVEEIAEDELDKRQMAYNFPPEIRARFSPDILNGYVFDHDFTLEERRLYLRSHATRVPFASRLVIPVPEMNKTVIVLGDGVFDPEEPMVGVDQDRFEAWTKSLVARFIENKAVPFASLTGDRLLTISKLVVDGDSIVRDTDRTRKKFEPVRCGDGTNSKNVMLAFSKLIDKNGAGVPKSIADTNKPTWCMYIELLAREEHKCFWLTPEELAVLYNKDNEKVFRAEFKK